MFHSASSVFLFLQYLNTKTEEKKRKEKKCCGKLLYVVNSGISKVLLTASEDIIEKCGPTGFRPEFFIFRRSVYWNFCKLETYTDSNNSIPRYPFILRQGSPLLYKWQFLGVVLDLVL